jgi:glc operon protein GlcG
MKSTVFAAGAAVGTLSLALASMSAPASAAKLNGEGTTGYVATVSRPTLTLAGARGVLDRAMDECRRLGASPSVAIVDDGGQLICFARADGSFAAGAEVSIGKARTAAAFRKPTRVFEDAINKGRYAMLDARPDFTPLQGGVPVVVQGQVVGAIGVSGAASAQQDDEIASAAASSLTAGTASADGK